MRVVSTTLAGGAVAGTIGEALASVVPYVDRCIVIDTGITDDALAVAKEVCGEKLVIRKWPWQNDFAKARNYAARAAHRYAGAHRSEWQIFVDTDERIEGAEHLRAQLEAAPADVSFFMVQHVSKTHMRERIFRLPVAGVWRGPTHEAYCDGGKYAVIEGVYTNERPKSPEQLEAKFRRDVAMLEPYVKSGAPGALDARWYYYLGDSYQNLREWDKAIAAHWRCADLSVWDEQGAWACYRAAVCLVEKGDFKGALNACMRGLTIHAGVAELAWYAGWICHQMNQPMNALAWANMARANGLFEGDGERFKRIGFKFLPALYEGPWDIIRWNLPGGNEQLAADQKWIAAYRKRTGWTPREDAP